MVASGTTTGLPHARKHVWVDYPQLVDGDILELGSRATLEALLDRLRGLLNLLERQPLGRELWIGDGQAVSVGRLSIGARSGPMDRPVASHGM